jgi:hypothetical protein
MKFATIVSPSLGALLAVVGGVQGYNPASQQGVFSRRNALVTAASAAAAALVAPRQALAVDDDLTPVYFGVGVSNYFFQI